MRKTTTIALLAAAGFTLTGCAKGIDDITPDMPRAEKDEIYVAWVEDTYGDAFPDMRPAEAPEMAESVCDVYDQGLGSFVGFIYAEFDEDEIPMVKDIVDTGVRVYCPEWAGVEA